MDSLGHSGEKVQQEMVNASKILTVSYGTFSCTLEGFDDPFSTMKDISEYFRNLASEDRFFGAEPPKLDADMLKHIAEVNTQASVSAQMGDNAVTLRPTDTVTETPEPITSEVTETLEIETEPEIAEHVEAIDKDTDDAPEVVEEPVQDVADETIIEEAPAEVEITDQEEVETPEDTSTVADRLARIRAVVAQDTDPEDDDAFIDTYSEDQHAEDISETAEDSIAALLADDHILPPSEPEMIEDSFEVTDFDDGTLDDGHQIETIEDSAPLAPIAKPAPIARAIVTRVLKSAKDIAKMQVSKPDVSVEDDTISPEDEAEMLAGLARIEAETAKRRAEALPATAMNNPADLERLFDATETRFDGAETSRAHANISHLKAAVAARNADVPAASVEENDETEAYREDLANAVKDQGPRIAEPQTETPETIEAERATPLVLVSEQRVDDGSDEDSLDDLDDTAEDDAIENLAAPSPEEADETPASRAEPIGGKVLPRRVRRAMTDSFESDRDTLASVAAAAGENRAELGSDFEDFATELGAKELVDILEAAAAYSQLVQGRESFSRPKLLHLAMEADETFSREEGLRSFGQLLRNGTIKKIKRGSFELTRTSRYAEPAAKRSAS
ncbi:hypothetical protein PM03_02620 [Thalassobacter stenotrophicus]|uniref:hypothetical protein n=1 Tax=Thalassobacter TaxID=266808 RepID=UPI00051FEA88|nr:MULTISPECIES: hypothetical protein [Thalassobacter]KGK80838.1 hypothetical protein PM03_02620 [Thalassobacter stenotrophicus]